MKSIAIHSTIQVKLYIAIHTFSYSFIISFIAHTHAHAGYN